MYAPIHSTIHQQIPIEFQTIQKSAKIIHQNFIPMISIVQHPTFFSFFTNHQMLLIHEPLNKEMLNL